MRYVGVALLLSVMSSQEVRLVLRVPRIGPPRDPRAGGGDGCASKRLARRIAKSTPALGILILARLVTIPTWTFLTGLKTDFLDGFKSIKT